MARAHLLNARFPGDQKNVSLEFNQDVQPGPGPDWHPEDVGGLQGDGNPFSEDTVADAADETLDLEGNAAAAWPGSLPGTTTCLRPRGIFTASSGQRVYPWVNRPCAPFARNPSWNGTEEGIDFDWSEDMGDPTGPLGVIRWTRHDGTHLKGLSLAGTSTPTHWLVLIDLDTDPDPPPQNVLIIPDGIALADLDSLGNAMRTLRLLGPV